MKKMTQYEPENTKTTHTVTLSVFPVEEIFPKGIVHERLIGMIKSLHRTEIILLY